MAVAQAAVLRYGSVIRSDVAARSPCRVIQRNIAVQGGVGKQNAETTPPDDDVILLPTWYVDRGCYRTANASTIFAVCRLYPLIGEVKVMFASRRARLEAAALMVLITGIVIYWWVNRPPSSETVARWVAEAIARRDARRLWNLMCESERQRVTQDNLRRVLDQLHAQFPYLADLAKPSALHNRGLALEREFRRSAPLHQVVLYYRRAGEQLQPLSEAEAEAITRQKSSDKTLFTFSVFVNRHDAYEKVCPLVIRTLVTNTIRAAYAEGRPIDTVLEEIFLQNNIRTALYEPHMGAVRAIRVLKQRAPDGAVQYYW